MRIIFFLFLFLFKACHASSGKTTSYECFAEASHTKPSLVFTWNALAVTKDDGVYYNSFLRSPGSPDFERPLGPDSKGGKYNVEFTENEVILRYIQHAMLSKMQLPSGQYTSDLQNMIPTIRKQGFAMIYSATFAGKNTYIFDKKQKKLTFQNEKLTPAATKGAWRAKKHRHTIKPGEGYTDVEFIAYLSEKEIKEIFPVHKESPYRKIYPLCNNVSTFKDIFRLFLRDISGKNN